MINSSLIKVRANTTSNGQVSEEEPARDERLLWVAGRFVHDVQVWGVKAKGSGRQAIGHKINPQKLHWNQSLRETQNGCQEDAEDGQRGDKQTSAEKVILKVKIVCMGGFISVFFSVPHQTTSPTLEEIRYLMNCFMLL